MLDLFKLTRPALFAMDAETAHGLTIKALKTGIIPKPKRIIDSRLNMTVCGINFANPVGLSAGFDKNAEVVAPMLNMGFGFVEAGTVTPKPQAGNPRPRVFRDPKNNAVINRMGFPNAGVDEFERNIKKTTQRNGVVGINIGMNKDQTNPADDYTALIERIEPYADYITINISSPNTPGLRDLQKRQPLTDLLNAVKASRKAVPVFLKLAPDLDEAQCEELAQTAMECGVDALILGNTTLQRPPYLPQSFANEKGGLSGAPLNTHATQTIHRFYNLTKGIIPIVGVGGIANAEDAYAKIKAGASLVQIYSALVFHGPRLVYDINIGLLALLERDGHQSIQNAVGTAHG